MSAGRLPVAGCDGPRRQALAHAPPRLWSSAFLTHIMPQYGTRNAQAAANHGQATRGPLQNGRRTEMTFRMIAAALLIMAIGVPARAEMAKEKEPSMRGIDPITCGTPRPHKRASCAQRCPGSVQCARWKLGK